MRWALVVPVKRLASAKSRLTDAEPERRQDLALAFALDTVTAALAAERVGRVLAVTDDPRAAAALRGLGVQVEPDRPDAGLNPALRHGVAVLAENDADGGSASDWVGALSADLPALRPDELDLALAAAESAGHSCSFVGDRGGLGTTLLLARTPADFDPRFGPRSRAAHRAAGAHELELGAAVPSLRSDVDTDVDLWEAGRLGVGPHTAAVLAES